MALDVLIAVSARRTNLTVVTKNLSDFEALKPYLNGLKVMSTAQFKNR